MFEASDQTRRSALIHEVPDTRSKFAIERFLLLLPPLLGIALMLTNQWFPAVDDECAIIDRAAQPISYTLHLFLAGIGEHEHPPLYDLILHGWLRLTDGNMYLLRVPAVVFYVLGVWTLAAAAKRVSGNRAQAWVLILAVLWPFGFHFGRVAAWYSFCFLLVSLLTWLYLIYVERPTLRNWIWVLLSALLLVYSNYFGWALLFLLVVDLTLRDPKHWLRQWKRLLAGGLLLVIGYLPILVAFVGEINRRVHPPHSLLGTLFTGIYNLYCIFVSESVAPWFWRLGVPAAACITMVLVLTAVRGPRTARRLLSYFICLLISMTVLGIVETKRLLLIAPWLVLAVGLAISSWPPKCWSRRACVLGLAMIAGIGWYGIFARNLYAAPHWVEPWQKLADRAARIVRSGGIVVGDNPSFFFYLTYSLRSEGREGPKSDFVGFLPESARHPRVYNPQEWLAQNQPMAPTVLLVRGLHYGVSEAPTEETQHSLSATCITENRQSMVYDAGASWKQRFEPTLGQVPWRIQLSTYQCARGMAGSANSWPFPSIRGRGPWTRGTVPFGN